MIAVERGWDQEEGVIEPKSRAGRRAVPLLATLRSYLEEELRRTGRKGEELVFGRTVDQAFYASTVDGRAKRAWQPQTTTSREPPKRRAASRICSGRSRCTSAATPSPPC